MTIIMISQRSHAYLLQFLSMLQIQKFYTDQVITLFPVILFESIHIKQLIQRMTELTLADIDFYERKIKSVEQDNLYLHQEIVKLRARLRIAQDYEIKYSLLVSNNQREMERLKNNLERQQQVRTQKILVTRLRQNDQKWITQINQLQVKLRKESDLSIDTIKKELASKTQQLNILKEKEEQIQFFGFKMSKMEKQNQNLKEEIEEMRQFYEKQRAEETTRIRSTLSQTYRQKLEKQKNRYEEKIINLQNRLNQLQMEDDNVKCKVSNATNHELAALKILLEQKSMQYAKQLQDLSHQIAIKNGEITNLIKQSSAKDDEYRHNLKEKNEYIATLEDKILEREKQHESQLLNLIQRLNAEKQQQKAELNAQIYKLNCDIARQNGLFRQRILNNQNEIDELNKKFDEERRKIIDEKNMHKRKYSQLSLKMKEADGQRESGDTQMLINSLRDMDIKEDQIGSYQNGITFLQRQYKKCQLKLQEKSRVVSKLYKDINDIRTDADKELNELKQKIKKDKKQNTERILALESQLRNAQDKLRNKQRQQRKRQRQINKEKLSLEEQNKSLRQLNQEMQRDYNRVIEDKKGVQASFREERQKSFASRSDLNLIKKQKWLELQKQKNELQIIFKEKQQQIKLEYEQKLDDKVNQLNKLMKDHEITQQQNEILKRDHLKLLQQLEENKQNSKMAEFNKKMTSLNLQISLTQNLYDCLLQAKSRVGAPSFQSESEIKIPDVNMEQQHQSLHMSFHPSAKLKF